MAVIIPELFSDAVNSKMETSLRIGRVAFDATDYAEDIRECGDTIHFPSVDRIGEAETMVKGTDLTPAELSMTDATAEVKQVGKAVRLYDKDKAQVKGKTVDLLSAQVGEEMAKAVDADLVNAMDTDAVYKTAVANADSISVAELEGGFDVFGDDVDDASFAGIIINSRLRKSFLGMDGFVKTDYANVNTENGKVINGVIGYYHGIIPVILCDNNTYDKTARETKTYIVKKDALGVIWQKEATTEEQRESLKKATLISADELYATKLINTKGVSILRKTIA